MSQEEKERSTVHELVQRLRRLDCCAVSDAIDKLQPGIDSAVITGVPQQSGRGRIAGKIITVKLGKGEPPPGPPRHLGTTAIAAGGPDDVIAVEQRTKVDAGCWGGLLTVGAKMRGIAGVIADGPVRDIDEARGYEFPIFTRALTAKTARGRIVEQATNVPITLWDVAVNPGDYAIADSSAIVIIRAHEIGAVLTTAEMIVAREAAMVKALLAGAPAAEVMGGNYEHLLKE